LERPLTLVLFLSIAMISGLVLNSVPQEGVPHWRDVWSLELLGLTFGVVGFVLTYLREEGELGAGTAADAVF
jgi:hypothetical protein